MKQFFFLYGRRNLPKRSNYSEFKGDHIASFNHRRISFSYAKWSRVVSSALSEAAVVLVQEGGREAVVKN